jgi:lysyl endopeptidase
MRYFTFFLLISLFTKSYCQISEHGQPSSIMIGKETEVPFFSLPLINTDSILQTEETGEVDLLKPFVFAYPVNTNIKLHESGVIDTIDGTTIIWRKGIASSHAYALTLLLKDFYLPGRCSLAIYSPDRKYNAGIFTWRNNSPDNVFAIAPFAGDSLILELTAPADLFRLADFTIATIGHAYKDILNVSQLKDGRYNLSGSCNLNINCPQAAEWQILKRAVCRIYFSSAYFCTGALVNNTSNDQTPYVLTANHCISNNTEAQSAIFIFNYESPVCTPQSDGSVSQSVSNSTLIATSAGLDFTLLELSEKPPLNYSPYYAGWDRSSTQPNGAVAIHHPNGDIKKISFENHLLTTATFTTFDFQGHWRVPSWDVGTTEKGSSGCPLFNMNKKIIGSLSGGEATCANSINDYFAKFSEAWSKYSAPENQLAKWLDKSNSGLSTIEGLDPKEAWQCEASTNLVNDDLIVLNQGSGWGYITGHNDQLSSMYAERFIDTNKLKLKGIVLNIAKANYTLDVSKITVRIWNGDSLPDEHLFSKEILINTLPDTGYFTITFDVPISVPDTFFVGYQVYYLTNDTFAIKHAADRISDTLNTAYVYVNSNWHSFKDKFSMNTSLDIKVSLCEPTTEIKEVFHKKKNINIDFEVFPNPASNYLNIKINQAEKECLVSIINIYGTEMMKIKTLPYQQNIELDLTGIPSGMYIVTLQSSKAINSKKIIIRQ